MRLHKTGGRKTAAAAARTLDYSSRSSSLSIIRQLLLLLVICPVSSDCAVCNVVWPNQKMSRSFSNSLKRFSSCLKQRGFKCLIPCAHMYARSKYLMCAIFCNMVESDLWQRVIGGLHSDGLEWKRQPNEAFNCKAFSCCGILPSLTVLHKSLLFIFLYSLFDDQITVRESQKN